MSTSDVNKTAVRSCFENASRGNFDALHEILSADYVLHPEEVRGVGGLTEMVKGYRAALADLRVTVDQQFAENDWVATRCTITGRHEGDLMGAPPSGKDVEFTVLAISRCSNGRIEEEWELADTVGLLRQIGALPDMATA